MLWYFAHSVEYWGLGGSEKVICGGCFAITCAVSCCLCIKGGIWGAGWQGGSLLAMATIMVG